MHLSLADGRGVWPELDRVKLATELHLDWRTVYAISSSHSLEGILEQKKEVFKQGLSKVKSVDANLQVDTQAKPLYLKACSVPFTLRQKVEQS